MTESATQSASDTPLLHRVAPWVKWLSILVIVVSLFFMMKSLPLEQAIDALRGWIDKLGVWGPLVYGVIYIVAVLLLVPGSVLTIGAGAIFGFWVGLVTVSLASTTAAALALLIARYLARSRIERFAEGNRKFAAMDRAISDGGWKIVAMLRLSPAVPFTLQNYFYGLTKIRFWPAVLTSWIAMLPGTFLYVYLGYLTIELGEQAASDAASFNVGRWVLLGLGLLATIAVTVYVTKLANKALKEQTAIDDAAKQQAARDDEEDNAKPRRWPWGATIALALAIAAVIGAATAHQWSEKLASLFRPPGSLNDRR